LAEVIRGKPEFLELSLSAILARGHILIEDMPGLGKTTAAKAFARLIADADGAPLAFKRIQFTPDLLPYDITGVDIWDPEMRNFRFMPGPVLGNIVLADEINRTTPKTQSALLEVMAEGQVTIGNATHHVKDPFFVIATQNPIESEGTYPLPAAQLDRFIMKLSLGYPDRETEIRILDGNPAEVSLPALSPIITLDDFKAEIAATGNTYCHADIKAAIADIVRATRALPTLSLGASPRAALHLLAAAKALAHVRGRQFVVPQDVSTLVVPVLAHRLRPADPGAKLPRRLEASPLIETLLKDLAAKTLPAASSQIA
jgi:MoxR-like ATPase